MDLYSNLDNPFAGLFTGLTSQSRIETALAEEDIEFGAPVFSYEGFGENVHNAHVDSATLTLSAVLVEENVFTVTVNGVEFEETFKTDSLTTLTALATAISAEMGDLEVGKRVTCEAGADGKTLNFKGYACDLTIVGTVTAGATQATATVAYNTWGKFVGVAMFTQLGGRDFGAMNSRYLKGASVNVVTFGQVWVPVSGTLLDKQKAYIVYNGESAKTFSATAANNYDCGCYFRSSRQTVGATPLAILEVRGLK